MDSSEKYDKSEWYDPKEGIKYGLASMKWYGWGSPVGLGLFFLAIGGFIYTLHVAGLIK